jgi:PCFT/HCP family folate transporter-like MFS transporter 1/3
MSKIVERDEIGKIFSFIAALDTIAPMFSATIFTYIFKYTMDSYPGTVYQLTALLILFPIFTMMWIDLFTERPLIDSKKRNEREMENTNNIEKENAEQTKF